MGSDIFFKRTPRISLLGAYWFFGVKRKSYAATIVKRIYDYYCRGANNLYLEYLLYYRKEFDDFAEFLDKKYNLFPNEISEKKSLLLCHKVLSFEADGHITDIVEDESIMNTLRRYLGENINDN